MARSRDDDDLPRGLPRTLNSVGQGLFLVGLGLMVAGLFNLSAGGLLWCGTAMATVGLLTRAAGFALGAHVIEHRGITLTAHRSPRDGISPATEHELVEQFVLEQAQKATPFVTRLADEQIRSEAGRGV